MLVSRRFALASLATAASLSMLLAACGSSGGGGSPTAKSPTSSDASSVGSSAGAAAVPASALLQGGQLTVGMDETYPPFSYKTSSGQVTGLDVDLAKAIGRQMRLTVNLSDAPFTALVTGLQAHRFDVIQSAFEDTSADRATFDFVDYLKAGMLLLVQKGNPDKIASIDDLCGKTVGVTTGSAPELNALHTANATCTSGGKSKISIQEFTADTNTRLSLQQGRIAADLVGAGSAAYSAKTRSDIYQTTGPLITEGFYGIVVPKNNTVLVKALENAVQALITNGTYGELLAKYGLSSAAISHVGFDGSPLT